MNVIVFGVNNKGKEYCEKSKETILALVDTNPINWNEEFSGHMIINPEEILNYEYDRIIIAVDYNENSGKYIACEILEILKALDVEMSRNVQSKKTQKRDSIFLDFLSPRQCSTADGGLPFTGCRQKCYNPHFRRIGKVAYF